jgi:hypothetical protein
MVQGRFVRKLIPAAAISIVLMFSYLAPVSSQASAGPGSSSVGYGNNASCNPTTAAAGGSATCTAHFLGGAGQAVTFSATGGGAGCVVTFNPVSGTTDASGNVTTTATFGANCSGTVTIGFVAGAQNVSTTVTVSAFPAASSLPLGVPAPFAWMAVLVAGLALVGAGLFSFRRRQHGA